MAKYDRQILVPYLHDIVALYLADRELERQITTLNDTIREYRNGWTARKPMEPEYDSGEFGCIGCFGAVFIAMAAFLLVVLCFAPSGADEVVVWAGIPVMFGFIIGGVALWYSITSSRDAVAVNKEKAELYEAMMREYEENLREAERMNAEARAKIPELERNVAYFKNERYRVAMLLTDLYDANVIPSHYRDMYASVYLYDWFSTSGADDLDSALNMYVLEQIKAKLDRIIQNQSEIILNQRMVLAKQRQSLEEQRLYQNHMQNRVAQICTNVEEQNRYLGMIEGNTAATAFFAAASYLKD